MGYEYLREQYPDAITKEQLYRICHISKRKALWLLEHEVIPCEDSGKKTRRFRIRLEDVIRFLERRDAGELDDLFPQGFFSSSRPSARERRVYLDCDELRELLLSRWEDEPDMLTGRQVKELCGYCVNTVNKWLKKGHVEGVNYYGTNLISKESLAEHLASRAGQDISVKSEFHRELLDEMQSEQQNSGMTFGVMSL